ncbi:hypothetical protein [Facklamia hominis]|uniref:hypothetical protein n=1 Tax=Facklamia hominis TaxID=178214 RepID=UPI000353CB7B|nr:hypothetical protein [Facklamia hominis]EPH12529.1 hypothetical protein HMPREF9260_00644 [Facklamia hominis ACS-120-V-Sch10]
MLADFRNVKKVYYNGSYLDSVYYGNDLIWETLKAMEDVFKRSEVDLTELDEQVWDGDFYALHDEYGSYLIFSGKVRNLLKGLDYLAYISINDWVIVVRPENVKRIGLNYNFIKGLPVSYLERIFGLPFPFGTTYIKDDLKNHKISLWFRKEKLDNS